MMISNTYRINYYLYNGIKQYKLCEFIQCDSECDNIRATRQFIKNNYFLNDVSISDELIDDFLIGKVIFIDDKNVEIEFESMILIKPIIVRNIGEEIIVENIPENYSVVIVN